jgi:hypothetical protein
MSVGSHCLLEQPIREEQYQLLWQIQQRYQLLLEIANDNT